MLPLCRHNANIGGTTTYTYTHTYIYGIHIATTDRACALSSVSWRGLTGVKRSVARVDEPTHTWCGYNLWHKKYNKNRKKNCYTHAHRCIYMYLYDYVACSQRIIQQLQQQQTATQCHYWSHNCNNNKMLASISYLSACNLTMCNACDFPLQL